MSHKPFFVLAPMDDVTDVVFRQIIASTHPPDIFFTEFVNVDGLQSPGRQALLPKLLKENNGHKIIAQIWGKNPDNFYKTTKDIIDMGFYGVDINYGCPEKTIVKNNCCSAMIKKENREVAIEIIKAVKDAAKNNIKVSVKTRLGFNDIDYTWHEALLKQNLNMLTIHARTRKEMSKVDARWGDLRPIIELRDKLSPTTKIVGNGDVLNRADGIEKALLYGVDGIMIGRGVFQDPYCFAENSEWAEFAPDKKVGLYIKHITLHQKTYQGSRKFEPLKKFSKVYLHSFDGASDLRAKVVRSHSVDEMLEILNSF